MADAPVDYARLAEVVAKLSLHEHLCVIYSTREEQSAVAAPYLRSGLERGDKCLYFADENTSDAALESLLKDGVEVGQHLRSGALTIVDERETDLREGRFDPDWWVSFLNLAAAEAKGAKFSEVRILGDLSWALLSGHSTAKLIEFESRINQFVRNHDARVICQYNRDRNSPELILGIIRTHPIVVSGGLVCKNPYYVPPEEFLKPNEAAQEVDRFLNNILSLERAQQALRQSEEHLRLVIDTVPALIHSGRPDGYLDFFNQRWLDYVGLSLEEVAGWKWTATIHPDDVEAMVSGWRAALATGEPFEHEGRVRRADGEYHWMFLRKVPLRDERGNILKWYGSGIETEDRKRAEDDVRRQKEVLQKIFDNLPVMIRSLGPDGKTTLVNREWERTMGWTMKEILEQDLDVFSELYPDPDYRQEVMKFVFSAKPGFAEFRTKVRDGRLIDTSWSSVRLSDGTVIGIGRDITERKRAEEALRASEERWRAVFENSAVGIALFDSREKYLGANRAYKEMVGYTDEELRTLSYLDITDERDREISQDLVAELVKGKRNQFSLEKRYRRKDGNLIWVRVTVSEAHDADGKYQFGMAVVEDITERKRAEDALLQSDQRYKDFISHSKEGVWRIELEKPIPVGLPADEVVGHLLQHGFFAECNEPLAQISGFAHASEVQGKRLGEIFSLTDHGRIESIRQHVRDGWRSRPVQFETVDLVGNRKILERTVVPIIENGNVVRIWGTTRDITELRRAEESLRESEERFRATFENAGVAMALVNAEGHPIKCNHALQEMLGYREDELSRMAFTEFTHPDDRELDWGLYSDLTAGKRDKYEIEKRYLKKDGGVVWGLLTVSLVRGRHGRPEYAVGMVQDITERKRAEEKLQRSRDQLRALAARLQDVREEERTRVAREIHDELGQALTAIKIGLSSLNHDMPTDKRQKSESILKQVDETIHSVRRISTELRPAILDALGLVAAVEWAAEEFEARTGTKCRLDLPEEDIAIDQERATALFRIFQETLTNVARHANATEVRVRLANQNGDLLLEVHDNGKGISEEKISSAESLGVLGMRERALLLGGELNISAGPEKGAMVRVRIPKSQPP